jgi:hypothetical protein
MSERSLTPSAFDDLRRGTWDSAARVRDTGSGRRVGQPSFGYVIWGFAGTPLGSCVELGVQRLQDAR